MSWNEKQKPQRFRRYAVMLMMLLTLGVGQMWGASGTIYVTPANMWGGSWDYSTSKLKIGYNYNSNNGDQWTGEQDMTLTEYTFHNYPVYSYTVSSSTDWAKIYVYHYKGNTKQATYNVGGDNWIDFSSYIDKVYNGWHNSAHEKLALSDMDANTEVTMYFAYNNSNDYTIKANMRISNDYDVWRTYTMTSTGHTISGKTIYTCTFNDFREHLYKLQFQRYDGSTFKNEDTPINNSWTAMSTYGSKMYNGSSWVAYQYDVTLDQQEGSGGTTSITATCGSAMPGSKTAPSRTGYTFGGYYTEEDGGGTQYYTSAMASARNWPSDGTGPNTLYAKWTAKQTTVTLYANAPDDETVTGGGTTVIATYDAALPSFSALTCNNGYALKGYYTNTSGGTKVINADGTFAANSGIWNRTDGATLTLHAQWSLDRTLTYDANGGTGSMTDANSPYANGATVTVKSNSFTRTGYTFTGWNTAPGGGGTSYAAGATFNISANTTLYAQWTENKTAVTISASPAGTGTFTVNSVSGTSASVGVTTTATVVATPATDFQFTSWAATNCSASPTNNKSTTLTGNGSSATGTLTATFTENVASGWYLIGDDFGGQWNTSSRGYPLNKKYRGMEGVFYRQASVNKDKYHCIHNGTYLYKPSSNTYFGGSGWGNKITLNSTSANANVRFSAAGTYYIVVDTRGTWPIIWYETSEPDRFGYHSVNVSGVENAKGTCKVTLGSTSGFETTQFANGETFTVTVTGVSGWIPTIKIGSNDAVTWWKEQATYTADGTMSTSDITVTISYTPTRAVRFAKTTGCKTLTATGPESTNVLDNTKIKDGTGITFSQENSDGYTFSKWYSNTTGTSGKTYSTEDDDYALTVSSTDYTIYPIYTGKTYTVSFNPRGGTCGTASKSVTMGSTYGELATVTPPAGYVFDGWYTSAGGGTKVTSATQVTTAVDHTLYAHYIQKAQVYFKNTLGWSKVYVTYGSEWHGKQGAGNQSKTYHKMQLVPGTTDVYYDDIPDGILTSWQWNVAFDNTGFCADEYKDNPTTGTYYGFNTGEAVFRYDFDKKATMFVPTSNKGANVDGNFNDVNGVQYRSTGYPAESSGPKYTSGYWRTYNNTYSGYTMTYQKKTEGGTWHGGHKMESAKVGDNVFCFTVNMEANSQYNFSFYKDYNLNDKSKQFCYNPSTQINSSNCTNLQLDCNPNNSYMQTTVAGEYTFQLEMKADGHMYLSVIYPLAVGDFRVRYNYTKGSAKTYYSEIIKGRANGKDTISIFIHSKDSASSRSLTVERCTGISSGTPTWNTSYRDVTSKLPAATTAGGKTSGVYDFIITQNGSKEISLNNFSYWKQYTGNYYIRTQCADGGWDFYRERSDNLMTLSEYSLTQTLSAPFSHYYCRFISEAERSTTDISYAVATDYSPNISGTMVGDATIGGDAVKVLPASANVRFSWNEETNGLRRAYLKNAQTENARFLVLHGSDSKVLSATGSTISAKDDLKANELKFTDMGNWIYQVNLQAQPGAKVSLIANYNSADRYLIGGATSFLTIIDGTGSAKYEMIAVYDFKTNRLMIAWTPSGEVGQNLTDVDVLLVRYKQNAGTLITLGTGKSVTSKTVIGAIRFDYNDLVGHVADWNSNSRPLLKYFISFPFDVNVSDIFGLNSAYGDAYEIQMYDGAERARKGFFRGDGTTTFWKTLQPGDVMKANEGYCVIMDNDYLNNDIGHVWDNKVAGSSVYLYFPSTGSVGSIASSSKTIAIPSRPCTIDRTFTTHQGSTREVNHMNTDSHWNMMGVPIFANTIGDATAGTPGTVFANSGTDGDGNFNYYYQWNPTNNQFAIHTAIGETFKSMHSYMVQYYGDVTFTGAHPAAGVAARRATMAENYQLELQVLNSNKEELNRTYVELRENACDTFALNEDVYMSFNSNAVNIYTLAGNYDVAANVLSVGNHTIPVCVEVTKAGTYTFSMPSNFSGTATLVDTFDGTRTNLALEDYEVSLQKGVIEDRFILELDVQQVATAIDGASGEGSLKDGKAHKFLQNNKLYILQNGVLYDARGARVQ